MSSHVVCLHLPGLLIYRDLVLAVVAEVCRTKVSSAGEHLQAGRGPHDFQFEIVSAVSEAFNNVALHGSSGGVVPQLEIELLSDQDFIVIHMKDTGQSFDPMLLDAPRLRAMPELPESGMGLFIITSFMDEVEYRPGVPNVLRMLKRRPDASLGSNTPEFNERNDHQ